MRFLNAIGVYHALIFRSECLPINFCFVTENVPSFWMNCVWWSASQFSVKIMYIWPSFRAGFQDDESLVQTGYGESPWFVPKIRVSKSKSQLMMVGFLKHQQYDLWYLVYLSYDSMAIIEMAWECFWFPLTMLARRYPRKTGRTKLAFSIIWKGFHARNSERVLKV